MIQSQLHGLWHSSALIIARRLSAGFTVSGDMFNLRVNWRLGKVLVAKKPCLISYQPTNRCRRDVGRRSIPSNRTPEVVAERRKPPLLDGRLFVNLELGASRFSIFEARQSRVPRQVRVAQVECWISISLQNLVMVQK